MEYLFDHPQLSVYVLIQIYILVDCILVSEVALSRPQCCEFNFGPLASAGLVRNLSSSVSEIPNLEFERREKVVDSRHFAKTVLSRLSSKFVFT